ncbi:MAG: BatA domain-containing protein [Planctomycetota bacterium]
MLALTFLNPMLLLAVPLAAVPILIHLLNRRRFQTVRWAAMEQLLAALKRNRKRLRMEQWLVLLLRTLAVALLALLVARPQVGGGGLLGAVTHHVVVLDDSSSMQQRSGSVALWDKARDQVRGLADRLAETNNGDLFSLVRTGQPDKPELWGQRVGPDLGRTTGARLAELSCGDGTMDLGAVLRATRARAVATKGAGRTEYYVIGDQRQVDWLTGEDKPRPLLLTTLAAMDPGTERLAAMGVGSRDADNLGVVDVRRQGRLAIAGVPVELAVDVQNHGLDGTAATELAIEVDGRSRVVRPVPPLAPGERVAIPVQHTFHGPGDHRVEASFAPMDHYLVDDRRTLALPVQARSRVLLVDGEPDDGEGAGETMFLQVALDPGGDSPSGVAVEVVVEAALGEVDLAPYDMVWLCNVPVPTRPVVEALEEFANGGGGVVFFLGAQVDPGRYNEALWRGGHGLLPLPLGEIAGDPDRREHLVLTAKDHPICGDLGDVLEVLLENTVLVKRFLTIEEPPGAQAAVLARIGDDEGSPALVTRAFGSGGGEVVLFALSADKHWSNWPDTDVNLVMAHQVHRFAARARDLGRKNLLPDGAWRLRLDPGAYQPDVVLRALGAAGDERTLTATRPPAPADGIGEDDQAQTLRPLELDLPMATLPALGAYAATLQLHSGGTETRVFARNPAIVESKLVRLGAADFARSYPQEVHDRVVFRDESSGLVAGAGEGELWRLLGAGVLLALLLETLLAWRFGRR